MWPCEADLHQRHQNSFADPAGCSSYGYSITTFIRSITSLPQIRQVAHLMEHYMQAEWKPRATPLNFLQMVTTKDPRPKLARVVVDCKLTLTEGPLLRNKPAPQKPEIRNKPRSPPKKPFASTKAKDSGTSPAQPHPRCL